MWHIGIRWPLIVSIASAACGSSSGGVDNPAQGILVAGEYRGSRAWVDNQCGPNTTLGALVIQVTHTRGATRATMNDGTASFAGTLTAQGAYQIDPINATLSSGTPFSMTIVGTFGRTTLTLRQTVTENRSTGACRYIIDWTTTKVGDPNDLPAVSVAVPAEDSPPSAVIALVDVNVVTMSGPTALPHQTIVVRDGRVAALAPVASTPVPADAFRIEGAGRLFVLPGLTDMHVHMFDRDEMLLYLANGITTVRNMHGITRHLAWRDSIGRGELLGPRIFTAGPIIDGDPPTRSTNVVIRTPDDARRVVAEQVAAGFDFIKVYDNVPLDLYRILTAEARARGKIVVGHIPTPVGIDGIMEPNAQHGVEHAEELLPFFDDGRTDAGLSTIARRFANADIWLDPTIDVYASALAQSQSWTTVKARPEMAYLNPETARTWGWEETGRGRNGVAGAVQRFQRTTNFLTQRIIPEFRTAGVHLLAGSDAPIPALVPGFALLDELDLLRSSGLTPFEVLQTTTTNPATFLGQETDFGPLRIGRLADLLIVDANPLENLGALRRRSGVIVRGRWLSQVGLQRRLDSLAAKYRGQ